MFVTQSPLPHIRELDGTLGAGIHKPVTADWMELGRGNDFGELFHIRGLDIHNVEALVLNIEVPQVHTEIITADKGFTITVHGDTIYMVRMRVGVCSPRDSGDHGVMVCQTRQLESSRVLKGDSGRAGHAPAPDRVCWCEFIR